MARIVEFVDFELLYLGRRKYGVKTIRLIVQKRHKDRHVFIGRRGPREYKISEQFILNIDLSRSLQFWDELRLQKLL